MLARRISFFERVCFTFSDIYLMFLFRSFSNSNLIRKNEAQTGIKFKLRQSFSRRLPKKFKEQTRKQKFSACGSRAQETVSHQFPKVNKKNIGKGGKIDMNQSQKMVDMLSRKDSDKEINLGQFFKKVAKKNTK